MSKKSVDLSIRDLIEARAEADEVTVLGYLRHLFPVVLGEGPGEPEPEQEEMALVDKPKTTKKKATKKKAAKKKVAKKPKPEPEVDPLEADDEEIDVTKVKNTLASIIQTPGLGGEPVRKILSQLGVSKLSELQQEQYRNALEMAQEIIAEHDGEDEDDFDF
jgi:hypothetical protein